MEARGRAQIHRRSAGIFLCRLEAAGFLAVIHAYRLQPIRREPPQIDLHILRVVNLNAIEKHPYVLTAEAPDVDGLESTDAAIILHLHPRETVQHVGDLQRDSYLRIQPDLLGGFQHRAVLHGDDTGRGERIRLLGPEAPGNGQQQNKSGKTAAHYFQTAK